jgi:hypothetical protein
MNDSNIYAGYRYPAKIIGHAAWLYQLFTVSFTKYQGVTRITKYCCQL